MKAGVIAGAGIAIWIAALPAGAQTLHQGEVTPEQRAMSQQMHTYFRGELDEAAVFAGLGAGSGYAGGVLLAHATDATRAAAVPVLLVGVIQAAAGIGLLVRTGGQVRELDAQIKNADPSAYNDEELERMETVAYWFDVYAAIETILLVGGGGTAALGAVLEEDIALGAGLGTATQAAIMLTLDAFADDRADRYIEHIRSFSVTPTVTVTPEGAHTSGLDLRLSF